MRSLCCGKSDIGGPQFCPQVLQPYISAWNLKGNPHPPVPPFPPACATACATSRLEPFESPCTDADSGTRATLFESSHETTACFQHQQHPKRPPLKQSAAELRDRCSAATARHRQHCMRRRMSSFAGPATSLGREDSHHQQPWGST